MAKKTAKKQAKRTRQLRSQMWFNNPDNPGMTALYLDVMRPQSVTDINALEQTAAGQIKSDVKGLRLGALVRMSTAADHPAVCHRGSAAGVLPVFLRRAAAALQGRLALPPLP